MKCSPAMQCPQLATVSAADGLDPEFALLQVEESDFELVLSLSPVGPDDLGAVVPTSHCWCTTA